MKNKIIILGLDGVDYKYLINNLKGFDFIKNVAKTGIFAPLKSTIPPTTFPAWTSLMSGFNPGKTGVYEFYKLKEKRKIINSNFIETPRMWDIFSQNNMECIVIGVPVTYPAYPINGIMITGFLTPQRDKYCVYPEEMLEILPENYKFFINYFKYKNENVFLKDLYSSLKIKFSLVNKLIKNYEWDILIFVISETDWIQHFFYKHKSHPEYEKGQKIILDFFKKVDFLLSELLEKFIKNNYIFIVSDHGFGKMVKKFVHINTLLYKEGFLKLKRNIKTQFKNMLGRNLRKFYSLLPLLLKKRIKGKVKNKFHTLTELKEDMIDWENTKAYFMPSYLNSGFIKILNNEKKLTNQIFKLLKELNKKEKIFKEIFVKEEIYSGEYLKEFPEIIINFEEEYAGNSLITKNLLTDIPETSRPSVGHRDIGIFIASGPGIKKNKKIKKILNIYDIAPTIYYIKNLPFPEGIDGKIIYEIFEDELRDKKIRYKKYKIIKSQKESIPESKKVEERLKGLGYL